mmetsp:Transcript_95470/g.242651  ORF Transcript_95470/g.242651 Transcript_95470/m.242651 type:complete len:153 (-) Transcript_95470:1074-1532(-)
MHGARAIKQQQEQLIQDLRRAPRILAAHANFSKISTLSLAHTRKLVVCAGARLLLRIDLRMLFESSGSPKTKFNAPVKLSQERRNGVQFCAATATTATPPFLMTPRAMPTQSIQMTPPAPPFPMTRPAMPALPFPMMAAEEVDCRSRAKACT